MRQLSYEEVRMKTLKELEALRDAICGSGYPWSFIKDDLDLVMTEIGNRTRFKTIEQILEDDRKIIEKRHK